MNKIILKFFLITVITCSVGAQDFKIAVGSGFKKPFLKITREYKKTVKSEMEVVFGNITQITNQAKRTDISFLVGDKLSLIKKSKLNFIDFVKLGKGKLVLAYSKKNKLNNYNDLLLKKIKKIAIPHSKKTVYGRAGMKFLKSSGLYKKIDDKLIMVATAPQVVMYLVTNEVDAGFINLTAYEANKKKLGGYIEIPQEFYQKILIVAGVLPSCKKNVECKNFLDFLHSEKSKNIFKQFGL